QRFVLLFGERRVVNAVRGVEHQPTRDGHDWHQMVPQGSNRTAETRRNFKRKSLDRRGPRRRRENHGDLVVSSASLRPSAVSLFFSPRSSALLCVSAVKLLR